MGLIQAIQRRNSEFVKPTYTFDDLQELGCLEKIEFLILNFDDLFKPWQRMIILYILLLLLSLIGGIIFWLSEYEKEQEFLDYRKEFWTELASKYNETQIQVLSKWADIGTEFAETDTNKWEKTYSCFFAATTFTTIGFGFQAPVTPGGHWATFLYGLPAIAIYFLLARNIGLLTVSLLETVLTKTLISTETYSKHNNRITMTVTIVAFCLMSFCIYKTATDVGFGHGIYTYWHALYFLFQSTFTIGFGDVMMSGSNMLMTLLLGIWLSTTVGLVIIGLSSLNEDLQCTASRQISKKLSRRNDSELTKFQIQRPSKISRNTRLNKQNNITESDCENLIVVQPRSHEKYIHASSEELLLEDMENYIQEPNI